VGTPESVSDTKLRQLLQSRLIPPTTPVHFRCLYGGLFLFILIEETLLNLQNDLNGNTILKTKDFNRRLLESDELKLEKEITEFLN
jgi:hypothetical protein